jgi:hypothetical protein
MIKRMLGLMAVFSWSCSPIAADFSQSVASLHPAYPGSGPFLISISGTWPTDCHPGEQFPFVSSFDGHTVEIEFEIRVVHVTCNQAETPYRSLVSMYQILNKTKPLGQTLRVRADFDGLFLDQSLELLCPDGEDCSEGSGGQLRPERGLYTTPGRSREGLLITRQNDTAVLYPLVYNDTGIAEWLFSAAVLADGTFFADLTRWHGGDCFDCEPVDDRARPGSAGHISVYTERPDTIWVQYNDRPFAEYRKLVYGYEVFARPEGSPLTDLTGRWALSENHGTDPPLGDLSDILPPAFDVALDKATGTREHSDALEQVVYLVTSVTGRELGQLVCEWQSMSFEAREVCSFIDPTDQAEPLLLFYPRGPSTVTIEYGRSLPAIGTPPGGTAVRLD